MYKSQTSINSTTKSTADEEKAPLLSPHSYVDVSVGGDTFYYESYDSISSLTPVSIYDDKNEKSQSIPSFALRSTASYGSNKSTQSRLSQTSLLLTLVEKLSGDKEVSLFFTVCNMLPCLQGSAIFSVPFAFANAGLAFLPTAIVLCLMSDICCHILVDCLYQVSPKSKQVKRVFRDYAELAEACWGKVGGKVIPVITVIYITANNVVNVVLVGKCFNDLIGQHIPLNERQIMMVFSVLFIPPLFVRKLSAIAYLSLAGVSAIIIGSVTAFVVFIKHCSHWSLSSSNQIPIFDMSGYPLAVGILMYTNVVSLILPQIEGCMKKSGQIGSAIHISFGFSTIVKVTFGIFGALTFGMQTKELVSLNVSQLSLVTKYILAISLCTYAICNSALMSSFIFEKVDDVMTKNFAQCGPGGRLYAVWQLFSRIVSVAVWLGMAMKVPYFALLSGVIGAIIGSSLVFVFPLLFHLQLKWKQLSVMRKLFEIIFLLIGVAIGCLSTYSSVRALIMAVLHK